MLFFNKKNIMVGILVSSSALNQSQANIPTCDRVGYFDCNANYDCRFNIGAGNGKCISLNNMVKPGQYSCEIKGQYIGSIATIDYDEAKIHGIEVNHPVNSLDFMVNTQQAKADLSYLHFTIEMPGDYPALDVILHCNRQYA